MDQKKVQKRSFSQRLVSTHSLGFADVLGRRSCPKRTKKNAFLGSPRSFSKGPNHALQKVLTSENTLYMHVYADIYVDVHHYVYIDVYV